MDIETADFYRKALDASFDGVLIADRQGVVVYINPQYTAITGLQARDVLGKSLYALLDAGVINRAISLEVLETGKAVSTTHHYAGGRTALSSAMPVLDAEGRVVAVFNNTRNVEDLISLRNELSEHKARQRKSEREIGHLRAQLGERSRFVSVSKAMEAVLELAEKVAPFDTTVTIFGESGTGKEVLARYLHNAGSRAQGPFIKVNCAAIPRELFESELFGYERGAFTGASEKGRIGLFELAEGGTLFLDEIGELQLDVQSKVLRAIQEKEIQRLGGKAPVKLDVRLVTATNRDLEAEVREGRFREDLFFRLTVFPVRLPPLRERREDILPLIQSFMDSLNRKYKTAKAMTPDALQTLERYSFPGNVRELENLVEYLFILAEQDIHPGLLPAKILAEVLLAGPDPGPESSGSRSSGSLEQLPHLVDMFEKSIIEDATRRHKTLETAAEALGIHYSTLSRKMKKYGLTFRTE